MLDRIFRKGLKSEWRNLDFAKGSRNIDLIAKAPAESRFLDLQIVADDSKFLGKRNASALVRIQREAEERCQVTDRLLSTRRIGRNERGAA